MISFLSKIYPLILLAICILAVPLSSRIKKNEEENTFRMTRAPMFVGVATGVIFAIVLLALAFSDVEAGTYIAVALFSLMSLLLISSFTRAMSSRLNPITFSFLTLRVSEAYRSCKARISQ